jgi:hypothetical protein
MDHFHTYIGKDTTYITNIFNHSDTRIAYCTNNTIQNFLTHKAHYFDKFSSSGVYKITCLIARKHTQDKQKEHYKEIQ